MAFPVIASSNSTGGTSSASPGVSQNMPASIAAGDLLIAIVAGDTSTTFTASGWTELNAQANGTVVQLTIFGKIAAGSDTMTLVGEANDYASGILRITGHGVTTLTSDILKGTAATGTGDPDPPSVSIASIRDWLIIECFAADDDDDTTNYESTVANGSPDTFTKVLQQQSANSTTSCLVAVASLNKNTGSAYDPGVMKMAVTDEEWVAQTLAIPPTGAITVSITNVAATTSVGAVTTSAKANVSVMGVSATATAGTVTAGISKTVALGSVSVTTAVDSVSVSAKANAPVTNVQATIAAGSVTVPQSVTIAIAGVQATASAGSVTVIVSTSVTTAVIGVQGSSGVGNATISAKAIVTLTGVAATSAVGSVTAAGKATVAIGSVSATASIGNLGVTGKAALNIGGVSATASVGGVIASVGGFVIVPIAGVSCITSLGIVTYPKWILINPYTMSNWNNISPDHSANWSGGSID